MGIKVIEDSYTSTTEIEYVAVTKVSKEMMWLEESGHKYEQNVLHCDSPSAIQLTKNPIYYTRTKHI